jgi:hypothetical protein
MDRGLLVLAFLAVIAVAGVSGDYLHAIQWNDNTPGLTCEQMLEPGHTRIYDLTIVSNFATCYDLGGTGLFANLECFPNGTVHGVWHTLDDCTDENPDGILVVKPSTWGVSQCWKNLEIPFAGSYLMITCYSGNIPAPGTAPPPQPPPAPAPQANPPSPTPQSTPAPQSNPAPQTTPSPSVTPPSPSATPPSPNGNPPSVTPPSPTPEGPTSSPIYDIVGGKLWMTTYAGAQCAGPIVSTNMTAGDVNLCQPFGGAFVLVDCAVESGWPYGATCTDSDCFDCQVWPIVNDIPISWDVPRCVYTGTPGGFSATCSPVYAYEVPQEPPVAPPPIVSPAPLVPFGPPAPGGAPGPPPVPILTPSGTPAVTIDWSAQFGTSCNAPALFGSFQNATSCQTVYSGSAYAIAYCTPGGSPR